MICNDIYHIYDYVCRYVILINCCSLCAMYGSHGCGFGQIHTRIRILLSMMPAIDVSVLDAGLDVWRAHVSSSFLLNELHLRLRLLTWQTAHPCCAHTFSKCVHSAQLFQTAHPCYPRTIIKRAHSAHLFQTAHPCCARTFFKPAQSIYAYWQTAHPCYAHTFLNAPNPLTPTDRPRTHATHAHFLNAPTPLTCFRPHTHAAHARFS